MKFFKETKSYTLITLLEKLEIEHKYLNIFRYLIKLKKFENCGYNKINKKSNVNDKIEFIIELFKERYYLEQLKEHYNIKYASDINSRIINNILISEIIYNGILKIYIEYGLVDEKYSIYVLDIINNKEINITNNDLNNIDNYNICINVLNMLYYEILLILNDLLVDIINRMRRVRENV